MKRSSNIISCLTSTLLFSGCASIVDGQNQSLSVKTVSSTGDIVAAQCDLTNSKGTWFVSTPSSVTVHRAYGMLNVKCRKDGYEAAVSSVDSTTKSMAFGNILFGGVIGAGVDMGTGAAYDYPAFITIPMTATPAMPPPPLASSRPTS